MLTQRYKLKIAYRGTRYHGWQAQPAIETWKGETPPPGEGIPTIQGALTKAISAVVRHPVAITGASRTDAGVHAKGQLVHFDTHLTQIPTEGLRRGINSALPPDILVRKVDAVPDYFDAITCASRKRYQYYIWNAEDRDVFSNDMSWHRWHRLDGEAMSSAAAHLVGQHDFASFCRPGHGRENTVRTVYACDVSFRPPRVIISVEGSGFLWNMVRIIVGTLVQVGVGRFKPDDMPGMLAAKNRVAGGPTAPPHGLYLQWIKTRTPEEMMAAAAKYARRIEASLENSEQEIAAPSDENGANHLSQM